MEDKKDGDDEEVTLKPKMTVLNGVTVIVGTIIGSGIFITPTGVIMHTGSVNLALIVWFVAGIYSIIGAYCYAELGTMIRKSGADYAYILEAFGPFLGFMRLWVECMIVRPCAVAIISLTFSIYTLKPFYEGCDPPDESTRLLAICCIMALMFVNCWDVSWATRVQDVCCYGKLFALFIIIVTGAYQLYLGKTEHFTFENSNYDSGSICMAFYSGLFAYHGWNYLNFVIEELKDPIRTLPKAIAISCLLVTIVYVLTNIAFYTTLSPKEALESEAVAVTYGNHLFGRFAWTITFFVALSTFGAVNGNLLTASRLFYAGAMEGQMPEVLTMIQIKRFTPCPAVLAMALISMMYLMSSNIYALINYVGFGTWLSIGVSVLCLPWLRWSQPDLPRPIRVSLVFPFIFIAATLYITITAMFVSPTETGYGTLMILSSIPIYIIFIAWRNKPNWFRRAMCGITRLVQKLLIVVKPRTIAK